MRRWGRVWEEGRRDWFVFVWYWSWLRLFGVEAWRIGSLLRVLVFYLELVFGWLYSLLHKIQRIALENFRVLRRKKAFLGLVLGCFGCFYWFWFWLEEVYLEMNWKRVLRLWGRYCGFWWFWGLRVCLKLNNGVLEYGRKNCWIFLIEWDRWLSFIIKLRGKVEGRLLRMIRVV